MLHSKLMTSTMLSGVLVISFFATPALSADTGLTSLPAVSAINGKIQIGGGYADVSGISGSEHFYGAGALSMPLGDMFGLQADFSVQDVMGSTGYGGNVHLFARDPNSHLFGVIAGYGDAGKASSYWAGGEAELYMDNVSFELAAGYMNVNPKFGSNSNELFAFGDVAFYPVDNLRLSLGAASVAGFNSGNVALEYMLDAMPVSLQLKAEVGESKYTSVTAGVSFYFGGDDANKSLKRRHREDDPRNRVLDIFGSGAAAFSGGTAPAAVVVPPDPCDVEFPDPETCDLGT